MDDRFRNLDLIYVSQPYYLGSTIDLAYSMAIFWANFEVYYIATQRLQVRAAPQDVRGSAQE